jgi:hypothetical protein
MHASRLTRPGSRITATSQLYYRDERGGFFAVALDLDADPNDSKKAIRGHVFHPCGIQTVNSRGEVSVDALGGRKMKTQSSVQKRLRPSTAGALTLSCLALLLGGTAVMAADDEFDDCPNGGGSSDYRVTIQNLTYDQVISPPVVVVHDGRFRLFAPGEQAGAELAALAEDGMTGPLAGLLEVSRGVADYAVAGGGIPPGGSVTVDLHAGGRARLFSLAGMLISTNDAFVGVDGYALHSDTCAASVAAPAYDAGSETNTESCDHIPGPPCGNPGVRVTDGAEAFVHVHRGIQGVGDLDGSEKDWRNPVARIRIRRM